LEDEVGGKLIKGQTGPFSMQEKTPKGFCSSGPGLNRFFQLVPVGGKGVGRLPIWPFGGREF